MNDEIAKFSCTMNSLYSEYKLKILQNIYRTYALKNKGFGSGIWPKNRIRGLFEDCLKLLSRVSFWSCFWPNSDPGLWSSNKGRFLKFYRINILDNFIRSIDVLDPRKRARIQIWLRIWGLQRTPVSIIMKIKRIPLKLLWYSFSRIKKKNPLFEL